MDQTELIQQVDRVHGCDLFVDGQLGGRETALLRLRYLIVHYSDPFWWETGLVWYLAVTGTT
ncbi:hypothetical protein D3C80_1992480 [compost metagenome]